MKIDGIIKRDKRFVEIERRIWFHTLLNIYPKRKTERYDFDRLNGTERKNTCGITRINEGLFAINSR